MDMLKEIHSTISNELALAVFDREENEEEKYDIYYKGQISGLKKALKIIEKHMTDKKGVYNDQRTSD